jgi:beta-glucosidase/6-phospho-beta-glucosidase/beta-galactosidase
MSKAEGLNGQFRIDYFSGYVNSLKELVVEKQIPIKSYIVWSFLDNFEWQEGCTARFGVTWTDYDNNCERTPKASAGS